MRTLSCRSPLVGALAAVLAVTGIARAEMPEPGSQSSSNLGQTPGEFPAQPLNMLAEPTESGARSIQWVRCTATDSRLKRAKIGR